jgi:hypothetical protein
MPPVGTRRHFCRSLENMMRLEFKTASNLLICNSIPKIGAVYCKEKVALIVSTTIERF